MKRVPTDKRKEATNHSHNKTSKPMANNPMPMSPSATMRLDSIQV